MISCAQTIEKHRFILTPVDHVDDSRKESKYVRSHISYVKKTRYFDFIYSDRGQSMVFDRKLWTSHWGSGTRLVPVEVT